MLHPDAAGPVLRLGRSGGTFLGCRGRAKERPDECYGVAASPVFEDSDAGGIGLGCANGSASPAPALRARSAAAARPVRPGRHGPTPAPGRVHRRPPADRAPPYPTGGVRLLRRRLRRRAVAPPRPGGVRQGRVPPIGAPRRVHCRHQPRDPRQTRRFPVRLRPHRLHPHDAHRGRARGGVGRAGDRDPLRPLDDGHHDHRRPRRLRARRPAVVPALPLARPRVRQGPRRARGGGGLRHAHADRRHPGRRGPTARRPQRPGDPARPHPPHVPRRRAAPQLVVRPLHHRTAACSRRSKPWAPPRR